MRKMISRKARYKKCRFGCEFTQYLFVEYAHLMSMVLADSELVECGCSSMAERDVANVDVVGSSPISRS